jgi:Tol biopolymer transport system component
VVAFQSTSFQLIASDANGVPDVFVRDLVAGATTRVSIRTGGGEADVGAFEPALSGDGRVVAFTSAASNLVSGDSNNTADVFVHDRTSGVTERVSVSSTGGEGNGLSQGAAISFDGRFVAFRTAASNLVPGGSSGGTLVRDRQGITTTSAAGATVSISISGDGRYLAGHMSNGSAFVRDRFAAITHLYTASSGNDAFFPVISRNGRYVGVLSSHQLIPGSGTAGTNAYLYPNPL